ncbi:HEAT repeat domain-containing protein [Desulfovibrio mangrovi]|uniref:HEAT repeat domain-containing protein n=1 Tax=Desulfovibrio mangrovi TaxID=2976983 RepID=UPI002245A963|nr:HEAT repeat domain-containing protein [Desulfovibrio mangrovi]UZP67396.1 HEAT repeat domain-containing protein [Desulfovibrio mangrovi]
MTPLSQPDLTNEHIRKRRQRTRAYTFLLVVCLVAMALEGAACFVLLESIPPTPRQWIFAAALHLASSALPLFYAYKPDSFPGAGWYLPKLTGLIALFLPVIGIVGMPLTIAITRRFVHSQGLAHDFDRDTLKLSAEDEVAIRRSMDDLLREELATQPIVDILLGGDEDLKRGAIMLLKRMKSPRAIRLLKESLSDVSTEVRFFAHTALSQLEEDAMERLEKAEELAASGDSRAIRDYAVTCRDYAHSGLPEASMKTYYLEEARKLFRQYLDKEKQDYATHIEIGKICIELKDHTAALNTFSFALDYPETHLEGRLGRCWVYYDMRDWQQLRREMYTMRVNKPDTRDSDEFNRALYVFWAQQDQPSKGPAGARA